MSKVEYMGEVEYLKLNLPYLKQKNIKFYGRGSVATVQDTLDAEILCQRNPKTFRIVPEARLNVCPVCSREFKSKGALTLHLKREHTGDIPKVSTIKAAPKPVAKKKKPAPSKTKRTATRKRKVADIKIPEK
jgi:hypothetical protein